MGLSAYNAGSKRWRTALTALRFADTGRDTFYGDFFYDDLIPKDDFYRQLGDIIPWDSFAGKLLALYKGGAQYGRPPYHPVLMLKVLLLGRLHQRSLRELQRDITYNLQYKYFIGLAANLPCPDFTTISDFQMRVKADRKRDVLAEILDEIIGIAQKSGIEFGEIQIVDSTAVTADVNPAKDEARQADGAEPRDPDAEWAVKRSYLTRDQDGTKVKRREYFYGFKMHTSVNAKSGMITGIVCTGGKRYDGHELARLIKHDVKLGLPIRIVTADRGYDDIANHGFLEETKLKSAIRLNDYRLKKKDRNKGPWERLVQTAENHAGLAQRGRIEAKFGEAKTKHGLRRCRHVGLRSFDFQAKVTVLVMNLKRMVRLICGTQFYQASAARALA
jgi:IS5 family transposase